MAITLPVFLFLACLLLFGRGVYLFVPFYRAQVEGSRHHKFQSLDGLRGFLAFGVVIHHSVCYTYFFREARWATDSEFYNGLGSHCVSLFFMITGFLFWSKVITKRGHIPVRDFLKSRALRILPMYFFSTFIVLILIGYKSNWELRTDLAAFIREITRVLCGGWFGYGEINKSGNDILNGVFWTLKAEWRFYISIPFLGYFFYQPRTRSLLLMFLVFLFCRFVTNEVNYFQFVIGGIAAEIVHLQKWNKYLQSRLASLIAFCALAIPFGILGAGYTWIQTFVLGVFFVCVSGGNTLFGVLKWSASIFLGTISYSVYLIHMSILFICFTTLSRVADLSALTPLQIWTFTICCGFLILSISALSYRYIEFRFIERRKSSVEVISA